MVAVQNLLALFCFVLGKDAFPWLVVLASSSKFLIIFLKKQNIKKIFNEAEAGRVIACCMQGMLWNGMGWKENFSREYGIEDLINEIKRIFHTSIHFPYLLILILFSYKMQSMKPRLIRRKKQNPKVYFSVFQPLSVRGTYLQLIKNRGTFRQFLLIFVPEIR